MRRATNFKQRSQTLPARDQNRGKAHPSIIALEKGLVSEVGRSENKNVYLISTLPGILPTSVQSSSEEFNSYSVPGVFIITGTIIGTALILLNVLLIGFCLHRRTNKRIRGLGVE